MHVTVHVTESAQRHKHILEDCVWEHQPTGTKKTWRTANREIGPDPQRPPGELHDSMTYGILHSCLLEGGLLTGECSVVAVKESMAHALDKGGKASSMAMVLNKGYGSNARQWRVRETQQTLQGVTQGKHSISCKELSKVSTAQHTFQGVTHEKSKEAELHLPKELLRLALVLALDEILQDWRLVQVQGSQLLWCHAWHLHNTLVMRWQQCR